MWTSDVLTKNRIEEITSGKKILYLLLRRKKAPSSWYDMTPAQRSRTEYSKQEVFGPNVLLALVKAYQSQTGSWVWSSLSSPHCGKCEDLLGYEWVMLGPSGNFINAS